MNESSYFRSDGSSKGTLRVTGRILRTAMDAEASSRSRSQSRGVPLPSEIVKRRASLVARLLLVLAAVMCSSLLAVGQANAASHAGGWSQYIPATGPWLYSDCKIYAGVAVDNLHAAPGFHHFGAGGVFCNSYHTIAITVRQDRSAYGVVQEAGTPGSFGPLYSNNVYVPTGPACKNGDPYAKFQTKVLVTIDGVQVGGWKYSSWAQNIGQGCMYL